MLVCMYECMDVCVRGGFRVLWYLHSAKVPEEAPRQEWDTAARAAFVRHEQSAYTSPKGRRVMKTTDGKDLPPGCRDVEFLRAAHLTVPRGKLTEAQMERMAPDRSVESDVPVTLYTQRRGESVYSGTAAQGANPFARNSHFTNDIRDGREPHATAIDDISKVPHGIKPAATVAIGAELSIDVALRRFKARLADRAGVNGVRAMRHMLDRYDTSGDGQLSAAEFSAAMRDLRVDVTSREVAELVAYFDTDNSGRISLAELHAGLRPPIPDARLALVRRAFARADRGNDGAVTLDDLVQVLRGLNGGGAPTSAQMDNVKMVLAGLDSVPDGRVTLQEFVDYYADVSSMIPDDGEFEALMANCWKLHVAGASGGPKVKVLVIHNDSSQEVVEVSSQGVSKKDLPLIRALLRKAGVKSIHSVKVL